MFWVLAVLLGATAPTLAQTDVKRVALLVSNDVYPDAEPTGNKADEDAQTFGKQLERDGFATEIRKNLTKQDMQGTINAFLAKVTPNSAALFYYKGVGIQVAHQNYLIPVNAEVWSEADVKREGVSIDALVNEANRRGASVKIVVLDASRPNPFERRFRSYSAGLAGLDAPDGSIVLFASAPNKIGLEERGPISLFMGELVRQVAAPDSDVAAAFTRTQAKVSKSSSGQQVPWVASLLIDTFPCAPTAAKAEAVTAPPIVPQPVRPIAEDVTPPVTSQPPRPLTEVAPVIPTEPPPSKVAAVPVSRPPVPPKPPQPASPPPLTPSDLKPFSAFRDCAECPELIVLPPGDFEMGSGTTPFDKPVHRVTIAKPFAIGRTLVTFDDWTLCADEGGCKVRPDTQGFGGGTRPVINVSWYDAKDYAGWLSSKTGKAYRLPSEAEWEYAAHGGTTTSFYWGASLGTGMADCSDCGGNRTVRRTEPVKSYAANKFGLYDMAGNAAEWLEDCWNLSYKGAPRDGSAWLKGNCATRVLRGGSFDTTSAYIRPTARFRYDADVRYWANGFRLVRNVP